MGRSSRRAFAGQAASAPASVSTVTAAWGRAGTLMASGWGAGYQITPVGTEVVNASAVTIGYGHGGALLADGTTLWWGKNRLDECPVNVGPSGALAWANFWEYRTGLTGQTKLESEGNTPSQVRAKEQAKTVSVVGQAVYPAGCAVLYMASVEARAGTWLALQENVGVEPGTDPETWVRVGPEPRLYFNAKTRLYEPQPEHIGLPVPSAALGKPVAIEAAGEHGAALLTGGLPASWGYMRYGQLGVGVSKWWGPKPRPHLPRPPVTWTVTGTIHAGSSVIEGVGNIGREEEGFTPPAKVRKEALIEHLKVGSREERLTDFLPAGTEIKVGYESKTKETEAKIELTQPALQDFTGKFTYKLIGREQAPWTAGFKEHAGWPVLAHIPGGVTVTAISAASNEGGAGMTLALTSTGEVLAWGSNKYGCLGNLGVGAERNIEHFAATPAYVMASPGVRLKGVVAIFAAEEHCYALKGDGTVWAWGKLNEGQGGAKPAAEGTNTTATPVLVEGLPTTAGERPVAITSTRHTGYVLLEDGTVMAWGGNEHGELGNGVVLGKKSGTNPTPYTLTPARIPGLTGVAGFAAGRSHVLMWTTGGKLFAWGGNDSGQVGDGTGGKKATTADKGTPLEIFSSGVLMAAAGEYNSMVLLSGATKPAIPLQIRFVPHGEYLGEQNVLVKLRWRSTMKTPWLLKNHPTETAAAEGEAAERLQELEEAENEEGVFEGSGAGAEAAEEKAVYEAELTARRSLNARTEAIAPTEIEPGVWEYLWVPRLFVPLKGAVTLNSRRVTNCTSRVSIHGKTTIGSKVMTGLTTLSGALVLGAAVEAANFPAGTTIAGLPGEGVLASDEVEMSTAATVEQIGATATATVPLAGAALKLGAPIEGTDMPVGATITKLPGEGGLSATELEISAGATGTTATASLTATPPAPLTRSFGYELTVTNELANGDGFNLTETGLIRSIVTSRLWDSPYLFGAF